MKNLVSKLGAPAGLDLGASRMAAEAGGPALSAQTLKEMAMSTKSIALIAATRRSKAQDREGGSGRSSLHLPEDMALDSRDPSPADRRWPHASPGRDRSAEKARGKLSPSLTWSIQTVGARWLAPRVPGSSWDSRAGASWWTEEGPRCRGGRGRPPAPPPPFLIRSRVRVFPGYRLLISGPSLTSFHELSSAFTVFAFAP